MPFPDIDPVAIAIGPLVIRWYALAFIFGLLAGWWYIGRLLRQPPHIMTKFPFIRPGITSITH